MLRQDKSIGAFVPCNVRLHLEPREGGEGGAGSGVMMKLSYIKTRTINITTTEETVRLCYQASGTVYMASHYNKVNTKQAPTGSRLFISQSSSNSLNKARLGQSTLTLVKTK